MVELEYDYSANDEEDTAVYRPAYNPDKLMEKEIDREIHGRKFKPLSWAKQESGDRAYDKWLMSKPKRKVRC